MASYTQDLSDTATGVSSVALSITTSLLSALAALSLVTFSTTGNGDAAEQAAAVSSVEAQVRLDLSSTAASSSATAQTVDLALTSEAACFSAVSAGTVAAELLSVEAVAVSEAQPTTVGDLTSQCSAASFVQPQTLSTVDLSSAGTAASSAGTAGAVEVDLVSQGSARSAVSHTGLLTLDLEDAAVASGEAYAPRRMHAWVMDSTHAAMTRYTDLPVTSLAWIGGKVIGLGDEGLYVHEGDRDDDRPIRAAVLTGETRLGSSMVKSLGNLYVEYTSKGTLSCRIKCSSGTFTYELPPRGEGMTRGNRAITGRGLRSLYWQFRFTNQGGADFTITQASVDNAASTNRRI